MPDGFVTGFALLVNALFLAAGFYIYLALSRQIGSRDTVPPEAPEKTFGVPDVILALALATLFGINAATPSPRADKLVLGTNDLIANALVSIALFIFVAAFLTLRGRSVPAMAGFTKLPFWRSLMTAGILLFAAYPLIFVADLVTQRVIGKPTSKQSIVELFSGSDTLQQRVVIIVLAVAIAPMVEEFIFRFFLYGVVRRYLGRFVGLISNAALFAAVHAHIPSAAPLFVLGACFTIAYEWSGSIVVAMTMHALFNSLTLVALAFPEHFPQQ